MAQDPNRQYDKTSLKIFKYDGVHRDYLAHAFRWGFVSTRLVKQQKTRILDIGCGVDCPLVKVLASRILYVPKSYLGVDLNAFKPPFNYKWSKFLAKFNFSEDWKDLKHGPESIRYGGEFDLITCLEVVEHMRMPAVRKLLRGARALIADRGRLVVSTPVFNGKAAKNHVNECTIPQLRKELEDAGWEVEKRFGTFMSMTELRKVSAEHERIAINLREYYGDEVVSCFLAPLYPDLARNNIWVCKPADELGDIL